MTAALVYVAYTSGSRRQSLGVLAIAVVLGPFLNILRVLSIMLNPTAEIAQIHSAQGLVFVSLGVVAIAALDWLAEGRLWPERPPLVRSENDPEPSTEGQRPETRDSDDALEQELDRRRRRAEQ